MKIRIEKSGIHLYDRISGTHILLDEIDTTQGYISVGPRTLSVALTDACDFSCPHCHIPRSPRYFSVCEILHIAKEFDKLGTLDIALGGGEPILHPHFQDVCLRLWNETSLGVSFTTHGHHLTQELISALQGHISFVRISVDGVEPIYSQMRQHSLNALLAKIEMLTGRIPFGINAVINQRTLPLLDDFLELVTSIGASELLLLPMVIKGKIMLMNEQWAVLDNWIRKNHRRIMLRVSSYARPYLTGPFLFDDPEWEYDYAYLSTDLMLRTSSYVPLGLKITNYPSILEAVTAWRKTLLKKAKY